MREIRRPRALRPGDRIAIVAPASGCAAEHVEAGMAELQAIGFVPECDPAIFERAAFTAGPPELRAASFRRAWEDPGVAAIVALRGGYGSAQLLPLLSPGLGTGPKAFVAYSDNTSLLTWLTLAHGVVTFHGPMIEGRLARGPQRYDRKSLLGALMHAHALGPLTAPALETLRPGHTSGVLIGGTLTQLAASLGTPFAFAPPSGCVLFLDEVGERPYRVHRMLTQLEQAGILARAGALVFNELPRCVEPGGTLSGRDVAVEFARRFDGPVLFGLPSGHTDGPTLTLPFGVRATVRTEPEPALIVEEPAVC